MVEHFPGKHEALGSIPQDLRRREEGKKEEQREEGDWEEKSGHTQNIRIKMTLVILNLGTRHSSSIT